MLARPDIKRHNGSKFILFFGANNTNGVCSNFYKSDFTIDGITFSCVEQLPLGILKQLRKFW